MNWFWNSRSLLPMACLSVFVFGCRSGSDQAGSVSTKEFVGKLGPQRYYTPANQILTPVGTQVELPGLRPQALALAPDGRLFVAAVKSHELLVVDPGTGRILQRVPFPSEEQDAAPDVVSPHILEPDKEAQISFTGLTVSPDGSRIFLANVNGSIKVFGPGKDKKIAGLFTIDLPDAGAARRKAEVPAGLAVSADGKKVYVALNLSNRLGEFDARDGHLIRTWDVGVAPYDVALANGKAYVSNWGGRRPEAESLTGHAGRGTRVRVDPVRFIANEGSVSVIDLAEKSAIPNSQSEILTGLHACALAVSPNGRFVVCCNSGSDTLSVIDTRTDEIVETICVRQDPADLFGAQPDALAFDASGKRLFVCNASQNAVAVFEFKPGSSQLRGLIPVGWFPGAIAVVHDANRKTLCVANIKGIGSTKKFPPGEKAKYNSHQYFGTLSLFPIPSSRELSRLTQVALRNMRYGLLQEAKLPARAGQPPRAVPERTGEPSLFEHVLYVIKENRTYDQVFGDMREGNGDPSLCVFGERITPNQHKLAREFVLLDNTYCSGICSADGHQWTDSAMTTDYVERGFAGWPRSYVDLMGDDEVDALAYSPAGFIWDNVIAHGKTLRTYGECTIAENHWKDKTNSHPPKFLDYYNDFVNQTGLIEIHSRPGIESLRPYTATNTVGWNLRIPDVFRAAQFIKELKGFEASGEFPNFSIMCLPGDHTSGTKADFPTPAACVADNDLALGQIVEAVSRSRFWSNTCIFVIEDDPQNGWDHVSGYRTTCLVISPYTRRSAVVSTQYNQTSLLRTMELMLGLLPMNQLDATATPMSDCFTNVPNLKPFTAVPNNIPLDQMNPSPKKISDPLLRRHAQISARLPLAEVDKCPEDTLNRILWHAMKGSQTPYPEWAVKLSADND